MSDRNTQLPMHSQSGHAGNFGMQQFPGQYVQPGMGYPMMQQPGVMMQSHGQMQQRPPNMMFPGQMGMMRPGQGVPPFRQTGPGGPGQRIAPPPYRPTGMGQQYRANNPHLRHPMSPETMKKMEKEKFYHEQKQKLKQFHTQSVDPNKLIESMFGKTEKPKVKEKPKEPGEDINDSFGDFIGGPTGSITSQSEPVQQQSNSQPVPTGNQVIPETNGNQSPRGGNQDKKEEKKVDINAMMMECSDLNAPNKAKTFNKPKLKEVKPSHHSHLAEQHESNQALQWKKMDLDSLGEMFVVEGPAMRDVTPERQETGLPHWCTEETKIPELYKHVLEASLLDGVIQTDRLYPILILSGLPKEVLGQIWSMCNKVTPGQLIKEELFLILGFVFLAQNNQPLNIELLHKAPHGPIPYLSPPTQPTPPQHPAPPQHPVSQHQGSPAQLPLSGPPPSLPISSHQPAAAIAPSSVSTSHHIPPMVNSSQALPQASMVTQGQITPVTSMQGLMTGSSSDSWHSHSISSTINTAQPKIEDDDDFADFQAAPKLPKAPETKKSPVKSPKNKPIESREDRREYLYSVPLPDDELPEHQISTEQHYSNVSNFFGSDDSSVSEEPQPISRPSKGASTPNSLDDDFDDFKSAGRPSDSSQFTSSEQSENEDFKVLESYLDDFSKKKQESPLHRPVSKTTNLPATAYNKNITPLPAVKSLWPANSEKNVAPVPSQVTAIVTATLSQPSSDSEFADFQQAPVVIDDKLSAPKSTSDLIGDEDKYAAFRVLETIDTTSGPSLFDPETPNQEDSEEWADFKSTETIVPTEKKSAENVLDLAEKIETNDDWSGFSQPSVVKQEVDLISSSAVIASANEDWSHFSQGGETADEEWADFQGTSQDMFGNNNKLDESPAPIISVSQSDLVNVKKTNLQQNEILGLFKPRDDPSVLSSYKLPNLDLEKEDTDSDLGNTVLETNIDEPAPFQQKFPTMKPDFRPKHNIPRLSVDDDGYPVPPPMDDVMDDEDEYGEFSRGYDIEDVNTSQHHAQEKKKVFSMYGMEFTTSTQVKTHKKTDSDSSNQFLGGGLQGDIKSLKGEDTNSVSSLELPFSRNVLNNVKDVDTLSISSNEFSTDFTQKKTLPDSKSVDSLELKMQESKSIDSLDLKAGETKSIDSSDMDDKNGELRTEKSLESSDTDDKLDTGDEKGGSDSDKVMEESIPTQSQPVPLFGDRYSGIMEDIVGSDKYAYEWQRCLEQCHKMIQDANNVFNSISSSTVCNEVIRSEQGTEYVQGVVEIYRIVCRITLSMKTTAMATEKLIKTLKDVDLVWNNLAAFLVGGNIMPDDNALNFKHCVLKSDDMASQMRACGVCLLDVDVKGKDFNVEEDSSKLVYGGRQYHATCANFWVNCVDSMLPALMLPELL